MRALANLGSRAAAMGLTILLTFAVTWFFVPAGGDEAAGAFFYAFTALYLAATVARYGAENLALRLTAADPELGRPWARPAVLLMLILGVVAGAVVGVLVALLPSVRSLPAGWLWSVVFASAVVPLNLLTLAGAWLRALGAVASGSFLELGGIAGGAILGLGAAALLGHRSLPAAFLAFAVSAWLVGLATFAFGLVRLRTAAPAGQPATLAEYLRRFGRPLFSTMLTVLGFFCFTYLGTLFLGSLHHEADVAHFTKARTLSNFVGLLATLQMATLSPQLAALQHAGDVEGTNRVHWRATALATGFGALVAAVLVFAPEHLLRLFGRTADFTAAAPMLRVMALAVLVVTAFGQVYQLLLTREGMERFAGRTTVVAIAVALLAMAAALPLGPTWVAAGAMLAPVVFAVAGHLALRRHGVRSGVWDVAR